MKLFILRNTDMKTKEKKHKHKWGKKFTNLESKSYYKGCKCGVVLEIPKPKDKK